MSTNSLTQSIVELLCLNGFVAWSQYNGAVYSKKRDSYLKNPNKKKGVPDICGFRKRDGKAVYVEVKYGRDEMSAYQKMFEEEALKAGCIHIVAKTLDQFKADIQPYMSYPRPHGMEEHNPSR